MTIEEYGAMPAVGAAYRRAATGVIRMPPRPDRVPDVELSVRGVPVDRDHLTAYDRVCGFPLADALPPTYPHVLAFPLTMALMSRPDFPFALLGIVHVGNAIEVRRPVAAGERLDLTVRAENLRDHDRGKVVDVVTVAAVDGAIVWSERSAYLHRTAKPGGREGRDDRDRPPRPAQPSAAALWRVPADIGRRYAGVSGDHNPIHTSRMAARVLGFPGRIAHGMWTKARCLAALAGRLPDAFTVDVAFKAPLAVPSTVAFAAARSGAGWQISVHAAPSGKPHLTGAINPPS
jgi:acyl dehydratase